MNGCVTAVDTNAQQVKPTAYQTTIFCSLGFDCVEKYVNKPPRHCACVALKESKSIEKNKKLDANSQIYSIPIDKKIEINVQNAIFIPIP